MGTDKSALVVDGMPMLERVLQAVRDAGVDRSIVAGPGPGQVPDPDPGQGPMAGIVAGWRQLRTAATKRDVRPDPIVVLACDLPGIGEQVIRALVVESLTHLHGAVAHDGSQPQPLIAAYRSEALDRVESAYQRGERSLRRCFDGWDLGQVYFDAATLADADRPEDLAGFDVEWPC